MLATIWDNFVSTSRHDAQRFIWLVGPTPHNAIIRLGCQIVKLQLNQY
jgi:hypothetical protein